MKDAITTLGLFCALSFCLSFLFKNEIAQQMHKVSHQFFGDTNHNHNHLAISDLDHSHFLIDGILNSLTPSEHMTPVHITTSAHKQYVQKNEAEVGTDYLLFVELEELNRFFFQHYSFEYSTCNHPPPDFS